MTRITKLLLIGAAAIALSVFTPASANHGAALAFGGGDPTAGAAGFATYEAGNGDEQTWVFEVVDSDGILYECSGFGSVEVGFEGCGFSLSGTEDPHEYPHGADAHEVTFKTETIEVTVQLVVLG